MRLETDRLILREMCMGDFEAMYAVLGDSDIMRHYPYTFDEGRVRGWIEKNILRYEIFGFGLWAVVLKETGEVIGDCGVTMQDINGVIRPEIGYHIARRFQRRGYAGEAARRCRNWAFENTPFNILYSYMKKDNVPSAAVARANGMRFIEEFVDGENEVSAVYGVTREEWGLRKRSEGK